MGLASHGLAALLDDSIGIQFDFELVSLAHSHGVAGTRLWLRDLSEVNPVFTLGVT